MSEMKGDQSLEGEFDELVGELAEEFVHRLRNGENPQIDEYVDRYPGAAQLIRQVLSSLATVMNDAAAETPNGVTETMALQSTNRSDESLGVAKLFGDYEIRAEIARGGMGVVYEARQKSLNRIVALKMIKSGEFANQEQVDRFYKEAEAAANLDHPGIVPVHEVGEINGQHYFTMGFVDGESLSVRLGNGPLPPKEAVSFAKSIAEAVAYAHSKGVIHRDLKPGNVLISKAGSPRITDFGLAKRIKDDSELTSTGQVLGTPSYMPPEQAEGRLSEIGPTADVYAIGATLYCMLVGRPPFQAASMIETLQQVIGSEPPSLRTLNHIVAVDLDTLCLKCLDKKPSNRYESADELANELGRFLNGEPIKARPVGRTERAIRWCRRKPLSASFLTLLVILAVGGPWTSFQQLLANRRTAIARVDTLLNASPAAIPLILDDLDRQANLIRFRLDELNVHELLPPQRLRISLALLPFDSTQIGALEQLIKSCTYEELTVALERMRNNQGIEISPGLWTTFRDETAALESRFRAGIALAALDSESNRWQESDYQLLSDSMLRENTVYQQAIRQSVRPLAYKLLRPVSLEFTDETAGPTVRESAANAIVDFARDDHELLTELSMVATPKQRTILLPSVSLLAESNETIGETFVTVTKLQPKGDDTAARRIALGKRKAGAGLNLVRLGRLNEGIEVLRIGVDPESLTQFVHGCKASGVKVTQLLDLLNLAASASERYGILLALGEFAITEIPQDIRSSWVDYVGELYANDPNAGVHGVSGWLLRVWGLTKEAKAIEEQNVPYTNDREWFTLRINMAGPREFEEYSYFTFVVFPSGEFQIGSPEHEVDRDPSDEMRRAVITTRPFAILDREVTRSEFQSVTGFKGYNVERSWQGEPTCAMSSTSWFQSVEFCRQLTVRRGLGGQAYSDPSEYAGERHIYSSTAGILNPPKDWPLDLSKEGFRLPTAAEWEIACRSGIVSRYSFGSDDDQLGNYGWWRDNSGLRGHPPRELRPNIRGLFDMHGNMYEWCHDWAGGNTVDKLIDPKGPEKGSLRVLRGGGWYGETRGCFSARRDVYRPARTVSNNGFRVVVSLPSSPSHSQ